MIKFFRKIRQRLLTENKLSKYLIYAVGEIVLVVIGILIALSINNWNEDQKANINERKFLEAIKENLKEDELQLRKNERQLSNSVQAIRYLSDVTIQNIQPDTLHRKLADLINFYKYHPIDNSYETVKSTGMIISNDKLRSMITRYYEYEQNIVVSGANDIELQFNTYFEPFIRKYLVVFDWLVVAVPNNINQNFLDALRQQLVSAKDNNSSTLRDLQVFLQKNIDLQFEITNTLEKK